VQELFASIGDYWVSIFHTHFTITLLELLLGAVEQEHRENLL